MHTVYLYCVVLQTLYSKLNYDITRPWDHADATCPERHLQLHHSFTHFVLCMPASQLVIDHLHVQVYVLLHLHPTSSHNCRSSADLVYKFMLSMVACSCSAQHVRHGWRWPSQSAAVCIFASHNTHVQKYSNRCGTDQRYGIDLTSGPRGTLDRYGTQGENLASSRGTTPTFVQTLKRHDAVRE